MDGGAAGDPDPNGADAGGADGGGADGGGADGGGADAGGADATGAEAPGGDAEPGPADGAAEGLEDGDAVSIEGGANGLGDWWTGPGANATIAARTSPPVRTPASSPRITATRGGMAGGYQYQPPPAASSATG
jgi:hypothetical protein